MENRRFKIVSSSLSEMVDLWERLSKSLPILKNESAYRKAKNLATVLKSAPVTEEPFSNQNTSVIIGELEGLVKEIESNEIYFKDRCSDYDLGCVNAYNNAKLMLEEIIQKFK